MLAVEGVTVTVTLLLPPFPPLGLEPLLVLPAPLQPPNTIAVIPRKKRTLARRITHLIGHFPFFGLPCTSGRGGKCVPCAGLGLRPSPEPSLRAFLMDEAGPFRGCLHGYSRSRQFGPVQISTTKGTNNLCTFSISSCTNPWTASFSSVGTSNNNSSCTCRIMRDASFSSRSRRSI